MRFLTVTYSCPPAPSAPGSLPVRVSFSINKADFLGSPKYSRIPDDGVQLNRWNEYLIVPRNHTMNCVAAISVHVSSQQMNLPHLSYRTPAPVWAGRHYGDGSAPSPASLSLSASNLNRAIPPERESPVRKAVVFDVKTRCRRCPGLGRRRILSPRLLGRVSHTHLPQNKQYHHQINTLIYPRIGVS